MKLMVNYHTEVMNQCVVHSERGLHGGGGLFSEGRGQIMGQG